MSSARVEAEGVTSNTARVDTEGSEVAGVVVSAATTVSTASVSSVAATVSASCFVAGVVVGVVGCREVIENVTPNF